MGERGEPDGFLEGTINHYSLLKYDADLLTDVACTEHDPLRMMSVARSAILLYIISLEVLINRVIDDFWPNSVPDIFREDVKKWPTVKKWECVPKIIANTEFDKGAQPFQYLKPLFEVRNDYVHAKADTYKSKVDFWTSENVGEPDFHPSQSHPEYKHIGLFKNPVMWVSDAAKQVKSCCEELVVELDRLLAGKLTDKDWLTAETIVTSRGDVYHGKRQYKPNQASEKSNQEN